MLRMGAILPIYAILGEGRVDFENVLHSIFVFDLERYLGKDFTTSFTTCWHSGKISIPPWQGTPGQRLGVEEFMDPSSRTV